MAEVSEEAPEFQSNVELQIETRQDFPQRAVSHYLGRMADVMEWLFIEKLKRSVEEETPTEGCSGSELTTTGSFSSRRKTKPVSFVQEINVLRTCAKMTFESQDFGMTCRGNINRIFYSASAAYTCLQYLEKHPELCDEKYSPERLAALKNGLRASIVAIGKAAGVKNGAPHNFRIQSDPLHKHLKGSLLAILYNRQRSEEREELAVDTSTVRLLYAGMHHAHNELQSMQRITNLPASELPSH